MGKEKKTCTTSRKIKEKTRRRLNSEVLLRTWPSLVQTQLNFFFVCFYSFSPSFSSLGNVDFSILVYFKRKM